MPAPKGNQNAKGKNTGRRPLEVELGMLKQKKLDAAFLEELFFEENTSEKIKNKIKSGKYSIKDVFIAKTRGGSERLITVMMNKIVPDTVKQEIINPIKVDVDHTGTIYIHTTSSADENNASPQKIQSDDMRETVRQDEVGNKPADTGGGSQPE